MKCSIAVVLILTAVSLTDCVPIRRKRFLLQRDSVTPNNPFPTPTTFPVPALPNWFPASRMITAKPHEPRTVLTGSSLLNSVHVQCPVKRSADFQRVLLDDRLMRELHLELVGSIDKELVSGDILQAEKYFKQIMPKQQKTKMKPTRLSIGKNRASLIKDIQTYNNWYNSITDLNMTKHSSLTRKQHNETDWLSEILEEVGITNEELKQLLQLNHDIEEIKQYSYHGNRRIKRSTTGEGTSRVEYCQNRGSSTEAGYLHLCSSCALTTQLPENVFPRYINELTCDQSDCDCFTVAKTSHGRCQPVIYHMKMLKRQTGGCRMVINNGTQIIVDDWTLYDQPVHVGCECVFKRNSQFATFIPKP